MSRVFASMAFADALVLIGAVVLGFLVDGRTFVDMHIGLAVFGGVVACLSHVTALMFLVVLEKLTRQAVELGQLDRTPWQEITRLKTGVSACLGLGVVTLVLAVGTGATVMWWKLELHLLHQFAVWVALIVNFAAFYVEYHKIGEAAQHRDRAFDEYNRREKNTVPTTSTRSPIQ